MEKKLKTFSIVLGIIVTGTSIASAFGITPWISDIFVKPDFNVIVDQSNKNLTNPVMSLTIQNVGHKQITDVTIHISSNKSIWKIDQLCSEATGFSQNSTDYKIKFERMSVDIPCDVTFTSKSGGVIYNVDAVGLDAIGFHWTIFKNISDTIIAVNIISIILFILSIVLAIKAHFLKKNRSGHSKEPLKQSQSIDENVSHTEPIVKNHKFIESRYIIPPQPSMEISLDQTEYTNGNDIIARITFSGITKGESIAIETYNPSNEVIDLKSIQTPSNNDYFDIKLFTSLDFRTTGEYSVVASTQFGPSGKTSFFYRIK